MRGATEAAPTLARSTSLLRFAIDVRVNSPRSDSIDDETRSAVAGEDEADIVVEPLVHTLTRRHALRELFEDVDADHSDTIEIKEVMRLLPQVGMNHPAARKRVVDHFKYIDRDNSGKVCFDEFLEATIESSGRKYRNLAEEQYSRQFDVEIFMFLAQLFRVKQFQKYQKQRREVATTGHESTVDVFEQFQKLFNAASASTFALEMNDKPVNDKFVSPECSASTEVPPRRESTTAKRRRITDSRRRILKRRARNELAEASSSTTTQVGRRPRWRSDTTLRHVDLPSDRTALLPSLARAPAQRSSSKWNRRTSAAKERTVSLPSLEGRAKIPSRQQGAKVSAHIDVVHVGTVEPHISCRGLHGCGDNTAAATSTTTTTTTDVSVPHPNSVGAWHQQTPRDRPRRNTTGLGTLHHKQGASAHPRRQQAPVVGQHTTARSGERLARSRRRRVPSEAGLLGHGALSAMKCES